MFLIFGAYFLKYLRKFSNFTEKYPITLGWILYSEGFGYQKSCTRHIIEFKVS